MNTRATLIATGLIAASLFVSGAAHAQLELRILDDNAGGFLAWYDTDLDITARIIPGNGSPVGETWTEATTLAANFSVTVGGNTYSNWRLPTAQIDGSCSNSGVIYSGCTGGELGHIFSVEHISNGWGPIWSATESGLEAAWMYNATTNQQYIAPKYAEVVLVFAVHSGDIAAVPEGETYALMLAGLGLVGWRARRRG